MATDTLYYGGFIPEEFLTTWYADVKKYIDVNIDNMMARRLLSLRNVGETTEEYAMTEIDVSANEVIPKARSAAGDNITVGKNEKLYKIWRWPTGFVLNEDDVKKSPQLQSIHVDACMRKIQRAEDKLFYSGRTQNNVTGFATAAAANTNGYVTQAASSGVNTGNTGAWLTADTNRDIYEDLRVARGKLDSKYRSQLGNLYLVGNADSMDALWQKDPYSDGSEPIFRSVAPLFGRSPDTPITEWAVINDQIADNVVYIVTKNPEAAEFIQARGITIDDAYPRIPIGNYQVAIYEDVGIAIHDNNAFVKVEIN